MALLLLLVVFLSIPTIIGPTQIPDWPDLKIVEHVVSTKEMGDACAGEAGGGCLVMGCALAYFDEKVCHIWVSSENPSYPNILEHERKHCEGYDHIYDLPGCGGSTMEDGLKAWRARNAVN